MNLADARSLFPGAQDRIYLDLSLNGLMPAPARDAALAHLEKRVMGRAVKADLHAQAEVVRGQVARLLGAQPEEIAITKNVSEGLNLFAVSLDWKPGDNIVFCPELEHPNNVFLWYNLRRTRGVEVREVPPEDGHIPVARMAEAMDGRTRLVTASHVTFSPGFIADVGYLAREAHSRGALVLVDSAQSAGTLRTDVRALDLDAVALGTQKALMAFYGLGFLYVKRELAEAMNPVFAARYGVELGADAHETAIGDGEFRFKAGALRFELSNYNYVGLAAVEPSLDIIHSIGMEKIETHLRGLAARLAGGLLELGLPVAGGKPGPHLAQIVAVGQSGGGRHDGADDPAMNRLHQHLSSNGVRLSIRRGVLRMSVGVYNTEEEMDRVVELCSNWIESEG
ncbi:aminotransferase class V-fold PLP-dependent enzyme [Gemmatimonadota bacterium]